MYFLKYLFVFCLFVWCGCIAQEESSCSIVLNYIQKQLPHYGILKNSKGFVYVDVDDEYIHKLITFIQDDDFEKPPYFGNVDLIGAHITVIYPDEIKHIQEHQFIQEYGRTIYFIPKECKIVKPSKWQKMDEVYIITVEAPEIDYIRKKYGLPKRAYDFHITIGVKPKIAKSA